MGENELLLAAGGLGGVGMTFVVARVKAALERWLTKIVVNVMLRAGVDKGKS